MSRRELARRARRCEATVRTAELHGTKCPYLADKLSTIVGCPVWVYLPGAARHATPWVREPESLPAPLPFPKHRGGTAVTLLPGKDPV